MLAQLHGAGTSLKELSSEIEERFVACGRALQEQTGLTTQLTRQGRGLTEFSGRWMQDDAAVKRVGRLIVTHLDLSEAFAQEVKALAGTLDGHAEGLQALLRDQHALERSFAPMRFLHSFFRIESATLPTELQTLFNGVTEEMKRLHADVSASFAEQAAALGETRGRVSALAERLHGESQHHLSVAAGKRADVQRSLTQLETELTQTTLRNQTLDTAIRELNREIDGITVSLQYQDITRQKIEHVQTAGQNVISQLAGSAGAPFRQRLRVQAVICEVQDAQLGAVQQELAQATTTIKSGLTTLLARLQRIEQECLSVDGLKQATGGMETVVAEVMTTHRLTSGLMQDSLATLTSAIEMTRGFAGATTGATATMRRLATDLHLLGLNAQVQSVRSNHGGLEVLSGAASAISREAGGLSGQFERRLIEITTALTRFVARSEAFHEKMRTQHQALQAEDALIFEELGRELETGKALVTQVGSLLQQLKVQADEMLPSVNLVDFPHDAIGQVRTVFASIVELGANERPAEGDEDQAILAAVESQYTMDSEREAHAAAVARQTGVPRQPAPARHASTAPAPSGIPAAADRTSMDALVPAGASSDKDLSDNVELF